MPFSGEVQDLLVPYVKLCLDALGIREGPSHSEVMMTRDGPCLVETGARMQGLIGPKVIELATGVGTHKLWVDAAVGGAKLFWEMHARRSGYVLEKWGFQTFMQNLHSQGVLANSIDRSEIRELDSVVDMRPFVQPGELIRITRDIITSPGVVMQAHASLEQCLSDLSVLRALEAMDLYDVMPHQPAA